MIKIGEKLRKLRLEKGWTQEQEAELFCVSPQAVSRWEMGRAYPDITLLPAIAICFDTTVDALLGMDAYRREDALRQIHTQLNQLMDAERYEEAVTLLRQSLRLYPGDTGLRLSLAETLARCGSGEELLEAIRIEENVLAENRISMKAQATARVNLLYLYMRTGQREKARALVPSLSHIWESREMMMPEVEDAAYLDALRQAVKKALIFLCGRVQSAAGRKPEDVPAHVQMGVNFETDMSVEALLDTLRIFLNA